MANSVNRHCLIILLHLQKDVIYFFNIIFGDNLVLFSVFLTLFFFKEILDEEKWVFFASEFIGKDLVQIKGQKSPENQMSE